jgi:septum formation inhibitor-activating ATPase MinD
VNGLTALVSERSVIVCCGSGGVGKTTVSAVFALAAAIGELVPEVPAT